ncbi:MAG TPA: hypothetical protein VN442_20255 [Bryobacteraceae bacterium]|nr:hypothetical protein [Bryobacteraceae bacterium]
MPAAANSTAALNARIPELSFTSSSAPAVTAAAQQGGEPDEHVRSRIAEIVEHPHPTREQHGEQSQPPRGNVRANSVQAAAATNTIR